MICPECKRSVRRLVYDRRGKRCPDCNEPNFIRSFDPPPPWGIGYMDILPLAEIRRRSERETGELFKCVITAQVRTFALRSLKVPFRPGPHIIEDHTVSPPTVTAADSSANSQTPSGPPA